MAQRAAAEAEVRRERAEAADVRATPIAKVAELEPASAMAHMERRTRRDAWAKPGSTLAYRSDSRVQGSNVVFRFVFSSG